MNAQTFETFKSASLSEGFDQVAERTWAPGVVNGLHIHPFSVKAQMVHGDMWLTVAGKVRHLRAGDSFELAFEEPHAERFGTEGASYWSARKLE